MKAVAIHIIPNLTERSFGVGGETYPLRVKLKELGGAWAPSRKCWAFSNKRLESVKAALGLDKVKPRAVKAANPKPRKAAAKVEKAVTVKAPKAPTKAELCKAEPVSVKHLALQYFLGGGGMRPEDVSRFTGMFGLDRHGQAYGNAERKSIFWMLNSAAAPLDIIALDLCQDHHGQFHPEDAESALMDCITEYAGRGGMAQMMEDAAGMKEKQYEDYFPF
jgi:hypothetical protein